jgi:AraC-like DNA-binding protein
MKFSFLDIIVMLTFFQSALMVIFLLFHNKGEKRSHQMLAFFLFIVFAEQSNYLIMTGELVFQFPWMANVGNNFGVLLGTSLYFYALSLTDSQFKVYKLSFIHYLPLLAISVYNIVFYHSLSADNQINILSGKPSLWGQYLLPLVIMGHLIILGYLLAAYKVLTDNTKRLKQSLSEVSAYNLTWLKAVLGGFLIVWLIRLVGIPLQLFDAPTVIIDSLTMSQYLLTLLFVLLLSVKALQQHSIFVSPSQGEQIFPSSQSELDSDQYRVDTKALTKLINESFLWRRPALTIDQLSTEAKLPVKYVSQLLNQQMGVTFFEFINGLRVADAATAMKDTDKTILDIAFEVGFNSKSAFNRAFKKVYLETPSKFRQSKSK